MSTTTALSPLQALVDIHIEPRKVLLAMPARGASLVPLALLVLGNAALWLWYYRVVDIAWLQDLLVAADPSLTTDAERRTAAAFLGRNTLAALSVAGHVVITPLLVLVLAAYCALAGRALGAVRGFGDWFGLAAWSSAPALLLLPAMAMRLALAGDGQIAPEALNPLSLNQLVLGLATGHPWTGLASSISIATLWSVWLVARGLQLWTRRRITVALVVAALPVVAVYAIWALRIAARGAA
jgi:hypothetical protein